MDRFSVLEWLEVSLIRWISAMASNFSESEWRYSRSDVMNKGHESMRELPPYFEVETLWRPKTTAMNEIAIM